MEPNQNLQPGNPALHSAILSAIDVEPDASEGAPPVEKPAKESAPPARVEGADAAPDEGQPSGEEQGGDTEDAPPAVEPPSSWARDYKEAFRTLPPDIQRVIAERERDREVELRRGQDEAANLRKAAEAEAMQARAMREQLHRDLTETLPALKQRMDAWSSIDWIKLGAEDPGEYARLRAIYDVEREQFSRAEQERYRLDQQAAGERQQKIQSWIAEQEQRLVKLIPEWKDTEKGRRELTDVRSYLKDQGVDPQLVAQLSDAGQISIARKAMLYDRAQARISKPAPPAVAPRVQRPGAARPDTSSDESQQRDMDRLRKSGDPRDAAKLISRMI